MPIIPKSSYNPPFLLNNKHLQTILPSYMRKKEFVEYDRELFHTPDGGILFLDWSKVGSKKLLIISHGLCGHTNRHYVLSLVKAFNEIGWDCLAWNYRGTGPSEDNKLTFTTNNSSEELGWVTEHAINSGGYEKVALSGYSMGGNLDLLYLAREADKIPKQVIGAALFCATIDLTASTHMFTTAIGRLYAAHFLKKLIQMIVKKHEQFPKEINIDNIEDIKTINDFDERFTAPLFGFKSAHDYWYTASAYRWIHQLKVPTLLVNPKNDPFLSGECYPIAEAEKSEALFLEMPEGGGHCGFITPGSDKEWWPALRAKQFLTPLAD